MSEFDRFMKKNKKIRANVKYAATRSLCDESGDPLEWEIKPLTSADNEEIRRRCSENGKFDYYKYRASVLCACVVFPDLSDAALQDSYGAVNEQELLTSMVDDPEEYDKFFGFVSSIGDTEALADKVEAAKN